LKGMRIDLLPGAEFSGIGEGSNLYQCCSAWNCEVVYNPTLYGEHSDRPASFRARESSKLERVTLKEKHGTAAR
jgi:hypothetical protein